jgi:hypothetical protein
MHSGGWYHGSFWQRNILKKAGPLNASLIEREKNKGKRGGYGVDWSFRLIDFGRSRPVSENVPSWMKVEPARIRQLLTYPDGDWDQM